MTKAVGYSNIGIITLNNADTDYPILLKVGETSGAAGEDFDLGGLCLDFPYDLRLTNGADDILYYHLVALSGTKPNRLALFRVHLEVGDSLRIHYGKSNDTPVNNAASTFDLYGKLGAHNAEVVVDAGEEYTQDSIIYNNYLYVTACDLTNRNGGIKKYSLGGALQASYVATIFTQCVPIIAASGGEDYMFLYDLLNYKINRVKLSDNSITHNATTGDATLTHNLDIASMGWDTVNSRVILPVYITGDAKYYLRAYNMADLSVAWSYEISFSGGGACASPLILGDYVYWSNCTNGVLYKLNLADGTLADSIDLGDSSGPGTSYASPIYDPDNGYIYCISTYNKVHAVDPITMLEVWSHKLAASGEGGYGDHKTDTGMTSPGMKNGLTYHNGKVILSMREGAAGVNQYHAKVYALTATTGHLAWTNLDLYNDGQDPNCNLLTDDHVVLSTFDYDYITPGDYYVGSFYVLKQSDGTLVYKGALPAGSTCGGTAQAWDGRVVFMLFNGLWCDVKLGWGTIADSIHWMKNAYHNGYCGELLTIDPSLTFSTRSAIIAGWTKEGGTSIDAEGFGMRLKEHESHYGHVEKAASALANFVAETRIYAADANIGGTWMPAIYAYWGRDDWVGVGLPYSAGYKIGYQFNKAGVLTALYTAAVATVKTWYWVRVRADASDVYLDYSTDYITWTNLVTTARAATWAGAPALIIAGKGFSFMPTWPNPDLDNNYVTAGIGSIMHFLEAWQRKYNVIEPSFANFSNISVGFIGSNF